MGKTYKKNNSRYFNEECDYENERKCKKLRQINKRDVDRRDENMPFDIKR